MNKLKFLGRGSGYNVKEGNTSAYIIRNDTLLLIDCGEDVFKKVVEKNLIDSIKNIHILITHMHSDHVGSLGSFVGYCYWKSKITSNIYFYEKEKVGKFLELTGAIEGESFILHNTDNKRIDSLELMLSSSITEHAKTVNAYSFVLKFDKGNDIFYSGDTCKTNIDVIPFLKDGNIIYHDTCLNDCKGNVHTSLRVLSETVPMEYRKQVYCIHIDGENFAQEAEKQGFNVAQVI
ncbi:MBL fold metallo-hydrolase [Clostridium uliginosum]|uniref:Ribonuclease BN, tRNA processing enzyme n=1 Tax=Clostridium uliginosum TaxID=119641 RepID=A0A1I1P7K9_9CLOT|nr:MBL fold metallo-hydrolase [Clostridium uliginosum]SFD01960.1 Ribonuclease BN, tRNA processing enzyme [Clostridium uliginosum]